jgi:hypothetical protein
LQWQRKSSNFVKKNMRKIFKNWKKYREQRLREHCVKYAAATMHQGDNAYHVSAIAESIYKYIKEGIF